MTGIAWAALTTGIAGLIVGVYLGGAGMSILVANRIDRMRDVIHRQAHELLEVRRDARAWQARDLRAEALLAPEQVERLLERELVS
jgi:hypothetical protein